jgi:hypothetical protein
MAQGSVLVLLESSFDFMTHGLLEIAQRLIVMSLLQLMLRGGISKSKIIGRL